MPEAAPQKILIAQTAFLGDVVLALSMARLLKESDSRHSVTMLTTPVAAAIADGCPHVDETLVYDKRGSDKGWRGLAQCASRLREHRFDVVFAPHRSLRTTILLRKAGIRHRIGFDRNAGAWMYTDTVPYRQDWHEIRRDLSLVRHWLGSSEDGLVLPVIKTKKHVAKAIALAPGSVWATKRWPTEAWIVLVDKLLARHEKIVLIGGPGDAEIGEAIMQSLPEKTDTVENHIGKDPLPQTFDQIAGCRLIVTNDSAPLHFGLAVGTPVVAIFGPTVRDFGFYPVGEHDQFVETGMDLNCRPCGMHGAERCPAGTFDCMRSISVQQVLSAIDAADAARNGKLKES